MTRDPRVIPMTEAERQVAADNALRVLSTIKIDPKAEARVQRTEEFMASLTPAEGEMLDKGMSKGFPGMLLALLSLPVKKVMAAFNIMSDQFDTTAPAAPPASPSAAPTETAPKR